MNPEDKKTGIDTSKEMEPKQGVKIENSALWLQEVIAQNISLENIIDTIDKIKWLEVWWWYREVTDGDNSKITWIINSNYEKIDKVIFMLKHFFSTEDWLKQFEEYIKKNDKHAMLNKLWNIDIKWLIKRYGNPESLWITEEQYKKLVDLLDKNSSGR